MKKIVIFFFCIGCVQGALADHITGGEMYYIAGGMVNGEYQYNGILKLFMRCNSGRQFNNPTIVGVFDRVTGAHIKDINVPLSSQENLNLFNTNPCITDPPVVCYEVGYFYFKVSLPPSANGYILSSQVNFRVANINNLGSYVQVGATYTAEIPGITPGVQEAPKNTSAHFTGNDLVIVCADNSFSYSFAATDPDGDVLKYSFCDAYAGGGGGTNGGGIPPSSPPYLRVPYALPNFSGVSPLGSNVQINESTGLITGLAPAEGKYVVTVCVQEIRNGVVIAVQRKDLQINIASCSIAAATLHPVYTLCRDTKTMVLTNLSTSALIKTYSWQLFNTQGTLILSSALPSPTYTFPDTGVYRIHLFINKNELCSDSTSSIVRVYPGLVPQFTFSGICINRPTQFTNTSSSIYGTVNSYTWDFGDNSTLNDYSTQPNDIYTYGIPGLKTVRLTITDSKGCIDTVEHALPIVEKPPIQMAFRDSLICVTDKVQLNATAEGSFTWTPAVNIINASTPTPTVNPVVTTTYYADLDDNGCKNRDSVTIRVIDHVDLQAMADTTICSTDSIQMRLVSNGLKYAWQPAAQFINPGIASAIAITKLTTLYEVTATIGSCMAREQVLVTTVPYPLASAGQDTMICFNTSAQLHGNSNGTTVLWTPAATLSNATTLNPMAQPAGSTLYTLLAYDTKGCPKPGVDAVFVKMLPAIHPFAGNDTTIVTNQLLQLQATGGTRYNWTPPINLSASNIASPVAKFGQQNPGLLYKVLVYNEANCVDSAYIKVKVYNTLPSVFVPNAFSPNNDGKNDVLRPILAGIQRVDYFHVYNRWGQLVFSSTNPGLNGWNGRLAGKEQSPDAYVWEVSALDYNGQAFIKKGVVLLIR